MYPKNRQLALVPSTATPQNSTDTDLADLPTHSATGHFATAKIPASQLGKRETPKPAALGGPFIATTHTKPCGICGDTSGDCREIDIGYLCHSNIDGLSPAPGYRYRKPNKSGVWGVWAFDDRSLSPQQRESRRQELAHLQALRESNQRSLAANALPAAVRDRHYQNLLNELSLTPEDQAELRSRGLSQREIEAHGYRSVAQWQRLSGQYPQALPGISRYGQSLNNYEPGYLCPVRNVDGQIIGLQLRRRAGGEGGRYRWLSNAQSAPVNFANDELPLSVFPMDSPVLGFAEGTGPKPHIASLRLGINVIGAAGGQWAGSAEQLKAAIAHLQPQQFILYPDSGMTANAGVMSRYGKLRDELAQLGHRLQVAWWGQVEKSAPDIDELTAEQRARIQLLSWEEYVLKAPGAITALIGCAAFLLDIDTSAQDADAANVLAAQAAEEEKASLQRLLRKFGLLEKKANTGIQEHEYAPSSSAYTNKPDHIFVKGGRKQALTYAIQLGKRFILDISGTGGGKSTTIGELTPSDVGAEQLWYLSQKSRQPSTAGIEREFKVLPVKHAGMVADATEKTPRGKAVLRYPNAQERTTIAANCIQPELFRLFAERGIILEGADNPICMGCEKRHVCQAVPGWFKHDRHAAMSADRISAHPQSLSSPDVYDYTDKIIVWEEAGALIQYRKETLVTQNELLQSMGAIADDLPELATDLSPIAKVLRQQMNAEQPRYGFSDRDLAEALGLPEGTDLDSLQRQVEDYYQELNDVDFLRHSTRPETAEISKLINRLRGKLARRQEKLDQLNIRLMMANDAITRYDLAPLHRQPPTAQQLNEVEQLPADIRQLETELCDLQRQLETAELERERVRAAANDTQSEERAMKHKLLATNTQKRWLSQFLKALAREDDYAFQMQNGILRISQPEHRYRELAQAAKANIFLDATSTRERLAQQLGVDPSEIYVIQQESTERQCPDNLNIIQMSDRGRLGKQRSEVLTASIETLKKHLHAIHQNLAVIDFKGLTPHYWFRHNRGSNEFIGCDAMLLIGPPTPNIASLQLDYIALTGDRNCYRGNPAFDTFVKQAIDNEFWQAIGRLRALLQPDQEFTIYIVTNHELPPEMNAQQRAMADICPEAGTQAQQKWASIHNYCKEQFEKFGTFPTQKEVSLALGILQGTISKYAQRFAGGWKALKKIFHSLLEPHIANGIFSKMPEVQQQQSLECTALLEAIAHDPPEPGGGLAAFLIEIAQCIGFDEFEIAASQLSPLSQGKLLEKLLREANLLPAT